MSSKTLSVNTSQIQRICNDRVSIKAGHLQQQLKDKHQQYAGRVTIVDHHGTNDQQQLPFLCDANAYPSVVDKKNLPALYPAEAASSGTKGDKLYW